jgi:hypothetical protein
MTLMIKYGETGFMKVFYILLLIFVIVVSISYAHEEGSLVHIPDTTTIYCIVPVTVLENGREVYVICMDEDILNCRLSFVDHDTVHAGPLTPCLEFDLGADTTK